MSDAPTPLPLWELINPSDPYTFRAASVEIAAAVAFLLSPSYGARNVATDEGTPMLTGWPEWLSVRGIDGAWSLNHAEEIATAMDSLLFGLAEDRDALEKMIAMVPEAEQKDWIAKRQGRVRTSMNRIGEKAYREAIWWRSKASTQFTWSAVDGTSED
jgi:hypothetical protein